MTDAAITEHIIYLVNKHIQYLDTMKEQYCYALEEHTKQEQHYLMSNSEEKPPEAPKERIVPKELCTYLLDRITSTLENRSIHELSNQ